MTETVKTVDCTPTWLSLIPIMLAHVHECGPHTDMRTEFIKLATAADAWMQHTAAIDALTDEQREQWMPVYLEALERATGGES